MAQYVSKDHNAQLITRARKALWVSISELAPAKRLIFGLISNVDCTVQKLHYSGRSKAMWSWYSSKYSSELMVS